MEDISSKPGYQSYFIDGSKDSEKAKVDKWKLEKHGKFSASNIFKLMMPGKGGEAFSVGGLTYIEEVAQEAYTIYTDDENLETYDMRMGKIREPQAAKYYQHLLKGVPNIEYYGGSNPLFKHYCPDSGASPDCLVWKDSTSVSWGAEFKCPKRGTHWDYLMKIKDDVDLKMASAQYYGQCQMGMLAFDTDLWHWCSYNEYYTLAKDKMLIIEVKRDKTYIENLKIRLKMAVKKKWELIEQMKNR